MQNYPIFGNALNLEKICRMRQSAALRKISGVRSLFLGVTTPARNMDKIRTDGLCILFVLFENITLFPFSGGEGIRTAVQCLSHSVYGVIDFDGRLSQWEKSCSTWRKPTYHERNSNPHIDQTPWCVAAYNILQPEDPIKAGSFFRIAL